MILKFYTATWWGYCHNLRGFLDKSNISYEAIDIDEKPNAIEDLYKFQNGGRTIPMIVYPDQDHQVNPRPNDVLKKIESLD